MKIGKKHKNLSNEKIINLTFIIGQDGVYAEPDMNFEMNRIYPKGSYVTTQYEMQYGYRRENEQSSWYTTVGPVVTDTPFTQGLETELGGFVGGDIEINGESLYMVRYLVPQMTQLLSKVVLVFHSKMLTNV